MVGSIRGKNEFSGSESTTKKSSLQDMAQSSLLKGVVCLLSCSQPLFPPPTPRLHPDTAIQCKEELRLSEIHHQQGPHVSGWDVWLILPEEMQWEANAAS